MTLALYKRVVLTQDLPTEGLRGGDVGIIAEHYPASTDVPEGYETARVRGWTCPSATS
jgi:hypothetical protein